MCVCVGGGGRGVEIRVGGGKSFESHNCFFFLSYVFQEIYEEVLLGHQAVDLRPSALSSQDSAAGAFIQDSVIYYMKRVFVFSVAIWCVKNPATLDECFA